MTEKKHPSQSPYWRRRVLRRAMSRCVKTDWYKHAAPAVRKELFMKEVEAAVKHFEENVWK